jgi:hypothetical protein
LVARVVLVSPTIAPAYRSMIKQSMVFARGDPHDKAAFFSQGRSARQGRLLQPGPFHQPLDPSNRTDPDAFHPNAAGYDAEAINTNCQADG